MRQRIDLRDLVKKCIAHAKEYNIRPMYQHRQEQTKVCGLPKEGLEEICKYAIREEEKMVCRYKR